MPRTQAENDEISRLLHELAKREQYQFNSYFPDCKPECVVTSMRPADHAGCCRVLYQKSLAFMDGGRIHRERLYLAANRIGKTQTAAYEIAAHMTGLYPKWWTGKRYTKPIRGWGAGDTMLSTRDVVQVAMLGPIDAVDTGEWGGMLPAHLVTHTTRKSGGVAKCIDQVWVRHVTGGLSALEFKSYDQGRRAFQGTAQELIWVDEEPPQDVYTECLTRTMTTSGLIIATFTPLQGLTPFIKQYLETAVMADTHGGYTTAYQIFFPAA